MQGVESAPGKAHLRGHCVTTDPTKPTLNAVAVTLGIGMLLLLAGGTLAWWLLPLDRVLALNISIGDTEELIRSWGAWCVAGSIGLMVAHSRVSGTAAGKTPIAVGQAGVIRRLTQGPDR